MFLLFILFNSYSYGQRTINGVEVWSPTGITTTGTPSSGQIPTITGTTFSVPFNVIISPGAILRINGITVNMGTINQNRITVQCSQTINGTFSFGGMLNIDSSTLTRIGNSGLWNGITVEGHNSFPQYQIIALNTGNQVWSQGCVSITNSKLSYAIDGIRAWDGTWNSPNSPNSNKNGGIIYALSTQFTNNRRSIEFEIYNFPNLSYVRSCQFIWNDQSVNLYCGISGFQVRNIPIYRNTFTYSVPSAYVLTPLHSIGIDGVDFSFDAQSNQFNGTNIGIYMRTVSLPSSVNIMDNTFNNNWRGAYLRGTQQPTITHNKINDVVNLPDAIGLLQETGSGYEISHNTFFGTSPYFTCTGLSIRNTGSDYNTSRHNTFFNFRVASQSDGTNRNANDNQQGLKFLCNTHYKSIIDIAQIQGNNSFTQNTGFSLEQGITPNQRNAGNLFSRSGIPGHSDVFTQPIPVNYNPPSYIFCCGTINNVNPEHPFYNNGGINPITFNWQTKCNSLSKTIYSYPEDGDYIYQQIQHYNASGSEFRDSLYYWVDKWTTAYGLLYKTDLLMVDSSFNAADLVYSQITLDTTLDSLSNKEFNEFGRQLLDIRLTMASEGRDIRNLNEDEINTLERIVENANYWAKVRAENWLNLFDGRSFIDSQGHPIFEMSELPRLIKTQQSYTNFYPNPFVDNLELDYVNLNDEGSTLEIIDLLGSILFSKKLEGEVGHETISIKDLQSGIYFYRLRYRDYYFEKGKLIKN